jgi:uncharacterized protein DUF6049
MAVPAAAATVGTAGAGAAAQLTDQRPHPWIAITSVKPGFAQPTGKVTVSGFVANPTGVPLRGLSVQLWSSPNPLTTAAAMASYRAAPESINADVPTPAQGTLRSPVPAQGTEQWHLTLAPSQVGMRMFGVYPLAAHLDSAGTELGADRTFLPFWPGKRAARTLKPARMAWVWPLFDIPQQTVCGTLASNELAASVSAHGRLDSLLAAGETTAAHQALLTWAIDPALLKDVSVMSGRYRVNATSNCAAGKWQRASGAAKAWLAGVQKVAAQQDYFTVPYADVDVAALAHRGLDSELQAAFADGLSATAQEKVPGTQTKILGQTQRLTPGTVGPLAWPAGGIADNTVLEALAHNHVQTVILNSRMIHTPAAVITVPSGTGGTLNLLLANNTLTQILAGRRNQITGLAPSDYLTPPGARMQARQAAAFAKEQWFLAETAMLAATAPARSRTVIAAPPSRWNPLPGMALALLNATDKAPWLRPASLAGLANAGSRTGQSGAHLSSRPRTRGELSGPLLRQIKLLYQQVLLLDSIFTTHGNGYLSTAVDTVESSQWRGGSAAQRPARQLVLRDLAFVKAQLRQVSIVGSRVTLGGQNGVVPVSIRNGLSRSVTVLVEASAPPADHVSIGKFDGLVTVHGNQQRTIKIPVTATQAGTATLVLRLATKTGGHLPVKASLTVVATHFGTLAIVIISVALAVFLLTATARAIRRGGPQDGGSGGESEELDPMPGPRDPASARDEPDTVVSGETDDGQPAKEADEHASAPGGADRT